MGFSLIGTGGTTEVYLSLGSNMGDRMGNLMSAIEALDKAFEVHYDSLSKIYETEPWGFESDTSFFNAVVKYTLTIPRGIWADRLGMWILRVCKDIEASMGRTESPEFDSSGKRVYKSRIIDIDILFIGNSWLEAPGLKVPHPLMAVRDFVMIPLLDVASPDIKEAFPEIFNGK